MYSQTLRILLLKQIPNKFFIKIYNLQNKQTLTCPHTITINLNLHRNKSALDYNTSESIAIKKTSRYTRGKL